VGDQGRIKPTMSNQEALAKLRAHHATVRAADQAARTMSEPDRTRLMLDPSFLFSAEGVDWLTTEPTVRDGIVIPAAFAEWLSGDRRNAEIASFVSPDDRDEYWARLDDLAEVLQGALVFRDEQAVLSPQDEEVRRALLEGGDTAARILAQEWTFLQSQSWAVSKLRHPPDAFRDVGAGVLEFGRKLGAEVISTVVPQGRAPDVLTPGFLAKVAVKWVIVGGTAAGGTLLGPVGAAAALVPVPIVRAVDP
jgi:hypothetical protein